MPLKNAKWIWGSAEARPDEYSEFLEELTVSGREAFLYISADSNYAVYMNGALCGFGQYADFPHDKVYDKIDLSKYMRRGKNVLAVRVWYYGIVDSSTYYPGKAGVIYSLYVDGEERVYSSARTRARLSRAYVPYKVKRITWQLGLSFEYDAKCADGWLLGESEADYPFGPAYETGALLPLRPRSCEMLRFGETVTGKPCEDNGVVPVSKYGRIFDLGREAVGFICLEFTATGEKPITVAFGEHTVDGHVRQLIDGRDFSFIYHPTVGKNFYMNPYRRCGCRFVEIICDEPLLDVKVTLRITEYPVTDSKAPEGLTPIQKKIYDACVNTLKCCMHEHYEDCPWREQALYAMDSRNQMLSGYYAFDERVFPKANLELMLSDRREDGLLSICYPMSKSLAIPSFSLHFFTECEEYLRYTGDKEFALRLYLRMRRLVDTFRKFEREDGLLPPIPGEGMWNFYEWRKGLDGEDQLHHAVCKGGEEPDLLINTLFSGALLRLESMEKMLGLPSAYDGLREKYNKAINERFFDAELGLYRTRASSPSASQLGNALAILCGAAAGDIQTQVAQKLTQGGLVPATLSMVGFVYDALLMTDKDRYSPFILDTIEKTYTPMIELGNGTVWETELGESDFSNAGSLCHGWSAIPVYYFHRIIGNTKKEVL